MISILDPAPRPISAADLLDRINAMTGRGRPPLSVEAVQLLSAISERILADEFGRRSPRFVAVAYWLRKAAVQRLVAELLAQYDAYDIVLAPRGAVLHLPPTNVDTIFLYSWALSVLAGNCNIVRIPSQPDQATMWLTDLVCSVIREYGEEERQLFCAFPHESDLVAQISARCDGRMIWGGDQKVLDVSRFPMRPDGLSLGFPDRTSIAAFSVQAYLAADDGARTKLIEGLYNDIYWFDQMGCGSPRILFWVGDGDHEAASEDLERRIAAKAADKGYQVDTSVALGKINLAAGALADGLAARMRHHSNALDVLDVADLDRLSQKKHGGGMIYVQHARLLNEVAEWADHSLQTVVHFGFSRDDLKGLANALAGRGGFRLVPPGAALQFHPIWDGVPLVTHLTRQIVIQQTG